MNNNVKIFVSVIVILVLGVVATVLLRGGSSGPTSPGKYDTFAQCLKDKGAVFYGAFWCPHCQAQKKLFGSSAKLLPYVECSNLAGNAQLPVCTEKKIESYPTWEFTNAFTLESEQAPYKCTGADGESNLCKNTNKPGRVAWVFGSIAISSVSDPVQEGTTWTFPSMSRTFGEVPLESLASITSCSLPVELSQ